MPDAVAILLLAGFFEMSICLKLTMVDIFDAGLRFSMGSFILTKPFFFVLDYAIISR